MALRPVFIGNRYELVDKIGQGGMGVVYHAYDRLTREEVALKQVLVSADDLAFNSASQNEDINLSIAGEFQILASLRHPHIISVLDYGFDEKRHPFFTMPLLQETKSLRVAAHQRDVLGKIDLFIQVLQALTYLHQRGIVHRDLKPANVLVENGEIVKVLDFGLAMKTTSTDDMAGTLAYMAPELLQGQPATSAADLYAVGIMLYESFVGGHPFDTRNHVKLMHDIVYTEPDLTSLKEVLKTDADMAYPRQAINERQYAEKFETTQTVVTSSKYENVETNSEHSDVDPQTIYDVVVKLLHKDPGQRYNQAHQVLADLCRVTNQVIPQESRAIRESFLQAAKFVGRKDELAQLQKALRYALRKRGSVWLIGGESGVGKSRFLEELRIEGLVNGAIVVRGQGVEGGGLPYHLWREALPPLLLNIELNDLEAGILNEIMPDLPRLLNRPIPKAPDVEGKEWQDRLLLTIQDVFKRQTKPVVVLLEDLHWAHQSLAPIWQLANIVRKLPILIVGTYRDDERPDLPSELDKAQVISLKRLADHEIAELTQSMIGTIDREEAVVDLIKRETAGNTFMMIEVMRALAEEVGNISQIGYQTLPGHVLLSGMQHIIERRLAYISIEDRYTLELAAVIGRQIDEALLVYIQRNLDLNMWLYTCENANILSAQGNIWRFAHDKLRETILGNLDENNRIELERTVATAIEEVYGDDDANADILLEHWRHAQDYEKAAHYARLAGKRHARLGDYHQAQACFEEGLELLEAQPNTDDMRMVMLRQLGHTVYHLNDYERANQCLSQSLAIAEEHQDHPTQAKSLLVLSMILAKSGKYTEAIELAKRSLAHAEKTDEKRIESDVLAHLGLIAFRQGYYDVADHYHQRSLMVSETENYLVGIAASFNNLGMLESRQGRYDQARDYYERSLQLCREIGNRFKISVCLNNLGIIYERNGNYQKTLAYYQESLAIKQDINDQRGMAVTLHNLGSIMREKVDFEAAQNYFEQSLEISTDINFGILSIYNCSLLTNILLNNNLIEEAQQKLGQGLGLCQEINAVAAHLMMLIAAVQWRIKHEKYAEAIHWAQLALNHPSTSQEIRDGIEKLRYELEPHLDGCTWDDLGEQAVEVDLADVLRQLCDEVKEN